MNAPVGKKLQPLVILAQELPFCRDQLESWLTVEIAPLIQSWAEELEAAMFNGHNASILTRILPPFYETLNLPDRAARVDRLHQQAIQILLREKQFRAALESLTSLPQRQHKLEAICHENLGNFRAAAESYTAAGNLKDALLCLRSVPDVAGALAAARALGDHPATPALEWISRLQALVEERPEKFTRTVTEAEKKLLQDLLERALGVTRKKPATRKTSATRKTGAPSESAAPAAKKTAAKKTAAKRTSRRSSLTPDDLPF
jgi:hypothetical protein